MIELRVEGMSCQHCVAAITRAITGRDAGARVEIDLAAHRVRVSDSRLDADTLRALIADEGYTPVSSGAD